MFKVYIAEHINIIFDGSANSVVLPGAEGEFEILDYHRPIMSFLKKGNIIIDEVEFPIRWGVAKFFNQELIAFIEL